jgi:hypothetical protein
MAKESFNWVDEQTAMKLTGYGKHSLRVFTMNEKRKKLPIRTRKLNAKEIIYSGSDIENWRNTKTA